jgi:hypothetical protein
MIIKLFIIFLCAYLWQKGGKKNGSIRDIPVPIILAAFMAFRFWSLWFILMGGPLQMIRLGYGSYDPEHDDKPSWLASITHDRSGEYIRALWGFICSAEIGIWLMPGGYLGVWQYLCYIVLNTAINYCVSKFKLPKFWTDILVGSGISSLALFL